MVIDEKRSAEGFEIISQVALRKPNVSRSCEFFGWQAVRKGGGCTGKVMKERIDCHGANQNYFDLTIEWKEMGETRVLLERRDSRRGFEC